MWTYRELLEELKKLSEKQLDSKVIVYTPYDDDFEYQPSDGLWFATKDCILGKDHPIIHIA